jgi:hypothetical protein
LIEREVGGIRVFWSTRIKCDTKRPFFGEKLAGRPNPEQSAAWLRAGIGVSQLDQFTGGGMTGIENDYGEALT